MNRILRLALLAVLAGAIAALPSPLAAQSTNKPASKKTAEQKETSKQGKKAHPFRGKLAEVDKMAKTITIGKSVYQVTSETKMTKAGKPATLGDAVVGEQVSGYAKPNDAGKMVATRLTFGPKDDASPAEKKSSSRKTEKP